MSFAKGKRTKGYRSKLESAVATRLKKLKLPFDYETVTLQYVSDYVPDFILEGDIILEVKGVLLQKDRTKMAAVKKAHPDKRIVFVFQKPHMRVPRLKMTHAEWAEKYNFEWIDASSFKRKDFNLK